MRKRPLTYDTPPLRGGRLVLVSKETHAACCSFGPRNDLFGGSGVSGGFIGWMERMEESARRELKERTGLEGNVQDWCNWGVWDPGTAIRGTTISIIYLAMWGSIRKKLKRKR